MKKTLFTFLFSIVLSQTKAQLVLPVNEETKQAEIKEVVEATGSTKTDLYDRAIAWINKFYPNPNGVIQTKNPETGEIEGKAQFKLKIIDKKGVEHFEGIVGYTITLNFKDGKFRYTITRIHWKQASYFDASKWMDTNDPDYNFEKYQSYIKQTLDYFENLKKELVQAVKNPPAKKKDDW
ncbi:MAG: DUF4468 domain-containing protein [Bacteroidetes bacterium]|nr:DUF4468 domain-containing protein [Bacteroidota bacterium]